MNILYVVNEPIPFVHGGSTHIYEVAQGLRRRGHRVIVLAPKEVNQKDKEIYKGLVILRKKIDYKLLRYRAPFLFVLGFNRILRDYAVDIVIERFTPLGGAGTLLASRAQIPVVAEINSPGIEAERGLNKINSLTAALLKRYRHFVLNKSQRIIAPSKSCVPHQDLLGRLVEVCWGANTKLFNPSVKRSSNLLHLRGKKVITFLGAFREWHGVNHIIEAAKMITAKEKDVHFLMIGNGPLFDSVKKLVKTEKLDKYFTLTGSVEYDLLPGYLAWSDVAVAPFDINVMGDVIKDYGFFFRPIKIFEYMAMGLPVVTIDIDPLNKIVRHGHEGLLFEKEKFDDFGKLVLELLEKDSLRLEMGRNARKRVVEHFSWDTHVAQLDKILFEALAEKKPAFYGTTDIFYRENVARYKFASAYVMGRDVLDIGCGAREGPKSLASVARHVIGIDISKEAIEYAKKMFPAKNLDYKCMDASKLLFNFSAFDVVTAFEVIEHLEYYKGFIEECSRVLKEKGTLILSTPNGARIKGKSPNRFHFKEFKKEELQSLLEGHFHKVKILGQFHSKNVEGSYQKINFLIRFIDPLNLRYKIPYRFSLKLIRLFALMTGAKPKSQVTVKDFYIGKFHRDAHALIAVCVR